MSSGRLAAKALLLAMFAYGCADTTADEGLDEGVAPEATVDDVKNEIAAAAERGESFESAGGDAVADGDLPTAELAGGTEPTLAAVQRDGPHRTASTRVNGSGWNSGTLYYPTDLDQFGAIVMCPGFTAMESSIQGWGRFLASHGIAILTMATNTTMDQVGQRATQIQNALKTLAENPPSQVRGKINAFGASGWSMGGGGTWITAAKSGNGFPAIKTAVSLAGHNQTAGGAAGVRAGSIRVPTLLMNGSTDTTILGGMGQSRNTYRAIPDSTPKLWWETRSCGHFCWGGPRAATAASGAFMVAWQKTYLEGDERFKALLTRSTGGSTTSDFESKSVN